MITLSAARALRGRPRGPSGAPGAGSRVEGRELCAHDATTTVISFESLMSLLQCRPANGLKCRFLG
jgi:hypothetical protein